MMDHRSTNDVKIDFNGQRKFAGSHMCRHGKWWKVEHELAKNWEVNVFLVFGFVACREREIHVLREHCMNISRILE